MKSFVIFILLIVIGKLIFSQDSTHAISLQYSALQKPQLDTTAFYDWPNVSNLIISNDGNYVMYNISNDFSGESLKKGTLIAQAINSNWKFEISDVVPGSSKFISENSQFGFFIKSNDSLGILSFKDSSVKYIPGVINYKVFMSGTSEYLLYHLETPSREIVLSSFVGGKERFYKNVSAFQVSNDGRVLTLIKDSIHNDISDKILSWVDVFTGNEEIIWKGKGIGNIVFNNVGNTIAFTQIDESKQSGKKSVWLYNNNIGKATLVIDGSHPDILPELELDGVNSFNKNDTDLFLNLIERRLKPLAKKASVDVWSYNDAILQSEQLESGPNRFLAIFNIKKSKLLFLQNENESIRNFSGQLGETALVLNRKGNTSEWNWNVKAKPSYFLVNTTTGERKKIDFYKFNWSGTLSPSGKYLLINIEWGKDIYIYEVKSGKLENISKNIFIPEKDPDYDMPFLKKSRGLNEGAWLSNDTAILIYDEYDIWQVDPMNKKPPLCLTNRYGRRHRISFRLLHLHNNDKGLTVGKEITIQAFNKKSKASGFYMMTIGRSTDPRLLSMGSFDYTPKIFERNSIKARDANLYIVRRQSAWESPNFFWTRDFKSFYPISNIHPERRYNWMTAHLISFQTLDGHVEQAVIYKPENFDHHKKYSVIIHYYERKTHQLNVFQKPFVDNGGDLDIAWFVSRGYIVVTPDIHYKAGEPGFSALNSIVGVRNYLAKFSWIDENSIGIQGHSFGGYETNFVITHSNLFAAACASSGMSNFVSNYLGFLGAHTNHDWYENRISRIGATLWDKPELYIKNSPVFHVDKIRTPLLMVANKGDRNVLFAQGLEMFIAMRRLGKPVWMLQYDGANHGLDGENYIDYMLRMTQFFDFYLKHARPPKWMIKGIPAKMKLVDDGFEIDTSGKQSSLGILYQTPSKSKKVRLK